LTREQFDIVINIKYKLKTKWLSRIKQ
jgi:hypothetical protein